MTEAEMIDLARLNGCNTKQEQMGFLIGYRASKRAELDAFKPKDVDEELFVKATEYAKTITEFHGGREYQRIRNAYQSGYCAAQPKAPERESWYCSPCAVEVFERRCKICGKLESEDV